ncbi:ABC transporter ATP-binding protein [Effusibacillus lacus]|uniref:ABC transporter n=1 Tax=Effusibacillus lacus TaxID=1348429 RepID=A0A292YQW7_9BACL|nr:ABC transporter ATP-binding protein [Effusibacillus lacus]TCS74913.1 ATP-binding cassette subfamily B protein [Effusibacillus lacus]GAX91586.1 ABC transporter [Effusibacillus lacus]
MKFFSTYDWGDPNQRPQIRKGTLKRIMRYFVPYWKQFLMVLLCIGISALLGILQPLIIKWIIDDAIPKGQTALLNWLILAMVAAAVAASLFGVAQTYFNTLIGQGVMYDIRNGMYHHLHRMSLQFFTNTKTGDIMSRVNNDVNGLQTVVTETISSSISNLVIAVSTIVTMVALDWRLAALSIIILPLFIVPTRRVGKLNFQVKKNTQQKIGELSSLMQETLSVSGAMLVKAFVRQDWEMQRFAKVNRELKNWQVRQSMIGRWFFASIGFLSTVGPAIIYWYGGHAVIDQAISLGTVVAFTAFLTRLFGPVSALANIHVNIYGSIALFERLFEYLDMPVEIQDRPGAKPLGKVKGKIELVHVWFSYQSDRPILEDVTFTIESGQLVALVGPSGAGKSTVANLIPRLYDPTRGCIRIDGQDIRDFTLKSLGDAIGIVSQETFLFHTTIRDNLRYAKLDATDEEIIRAAKAANIHDMIASLPEGYDTVVGERGHKLSGGEKQRIAIARVILKDPAILLLDEATSALDSHSEALVQSALEELLKSRTSLVIAHRLSTVLAADKIVVLEEGRVVEQGTHSELLALNGLYASLYHQQFKASDTPSSETNPAAV